jgi:hypothetical protein
LDNGQRVATDGTNVYVVYTTVFKGWDQAGFRWYDGTTWSNFIMLGSSSGESHSPQVEVVDGVAHMVYVDEIDGDQDVMYRTYNGTRITTPYQVSSAVAGHQSFAPAIAVDGTNVHVVWVDTADGDMDIKYRNQVFMRWSAILEVSGDTGTEHQRNPDVAAAMGTAHIVWTDMGIRSTDILYRHWNNIGFGNERKISSDTLMDDQSHPAVDVDGSKVYVAYQQRSGTLHMIMMASYNGTWAVGQAVTEATVENSHYEPRLAVEGDNIVLIYRNANATSQIFYRYYNGTVWTEAEMVSAGFGTTFYATPDIDLAGATAHAIWFEILTGGTNVRYHTNGLDVADPVATVQKVMPYWMDKLGTDVNWEVQDDYGVEQVTLQYRFALNNAGWGRWTEFRTYEGLTARATEGQARFVPTDGEAWYEFRAWAKDLAGNSEGAPFEPEGRAAYDLTAPTGTLAIEGGAEYTDDAFVTLDLTFEDYMTDLETTPGEDQYQMRLSNDGLSWSDWEAAQEVTSWNMSLGRGSDTVYAQIMDAAGLISEPIRDSIILDTDAPTGTISINEGAEWTTSREVTLSLTFDDNTSGVSQVRFMNEAIGGDEPWENPVDTKDWTLPDREGMAFVYYEVRDNVSRTSQVYIGQIGLDTVAPTGSIIMGGGDTVTAERAITLTLTADDATSGVAGIRVLNEAVGGDEPWDNKVDTMEWELTAGSGVKTVYYQVIDVAGMVSEVYTASITLDTEEPTGSIIMGGGDTLVNTATVDLTLSFGDATSDIVGIRVQEEAVGGDEPWDNPVETLEFTLSAGDGEKTIYYQVLDEAGRESEVYSISFTVDTSNPFVDSVTPDNGDEKVGLDSSIAVRFSEAMDQASVEAAFKLEFTEDGALTAVDGTFDWSPDMLTMTYSPSADLNKGTEYTISLTTEATDEAGNGAFPAISYSFTTEGTGGGNGGNGGNGDGSGDEGGNLLLIMVVVMVVAMAAIMGMMFFMKKK